MTKPTLLALEFYKKQQQKARKERGLFVAKTLTEVVQMRKGNNNSLSMESSIITNSSSNHIDNENRGRKAKTCGKVRQKCGKVCVKDCGKLASSQSKIEHADQMADWLVDKLQAPYCRQYFCKCAYHLTYEQIASALVSATMPTVKSPIKYFNAVTKRLMIKQVA